MHTAPLVAALIAQLLLVPVVGMAAVGASERASSYGPTVLGLLAGLLGWSGVLVVVALIRAVTGAGDGMLVVAWAPPVLVVAVAVVGGKALHGHEPPTALRRALETVASVVVTSLPALLICTAARGSRDGGPNDPTSLRYVPL